MVRKIQPHIKKQLSALHSVSDHGLNILSSFVEPASSPTEVYPLTFPDPKHCGVIQRIVCQHQQKHPPKNKWDLKIFVKNINFKTGRKTMKCFLEKFGPVRQIRFLHKDGRTRSRGMAIVHFRDRAGVEKVLNATPKELICDNRELYVEQAEWKRRDDNGPRDWDSACSDAHSHLKVVNDVEVHLDCAGWDSTLDTSGDAEAELNTAEYGGLHISCLPDEVLLHIFSFLSLRQTFMVDRVCQRWRNLSLKLWQSLKHFQMIDLFTTFRGPDDRLVKRLLQRTNPACLDSVNLSYSARCLRDATVQVIGQLCPNLISVDLSGSGITNKGLRSLAEQCGHLENITLDNCHNLGEDGLWWLFHRCKGLQRISVENNKRLKGPCLHVLGQNAKVLNFSGCSKLKDVGLGKLGISPRCDTTVLTELTLNNCLSITDAGLDKLTQNCLTLQRLSLGGTLGNLTSGGVTFVGRLQNLQELHLVENTKVNDSVLTAICKGCSSLRVVDLTGCSQEMTDAGIIRLGVCTRLTHLTLSYLHRVTDEAMLPIYRNSQLRKLVVRACSSLTNQGMAVLAAECCHLEELDVSGCFQLGPATLQCFVEAAPTRDCVLTITCGGTSFEDSDEVGLPPDCAVQLMKWNYSSLHMRHDRDLFFSPYESDDGSEHQEFDEYDDAGAGEWPAVWMDHDRDEDFLDNDDPLAVWDLS